MWSCEICETNNADDKTECRVCKAKRSSLKSDVFQAEMQEPVSPPVQVFPDPFPEHNPAAPPEPAMKITILSEPAAAGTLSKTPMNADLEKAYSYEAVKKDLMKKRLIRRIILAVINAALLIANIITVILTIR